MLATRWFGWSVILGLTLGSAGTAHAQTPTTGLLLRGATLNSFEGGQGFAPGAYVAPQVQPVVPLGQPVVPTVDPNWRSPARFNVGRYFLEALGGGLVGGLAAYGVYASACGSDPCLGGALGALGVNVALTPLAVWLIGMGLGGQGSLGYTYVGGLIAFSPASGPGLDPGVVLAVGSILMPFTAAAIYELTSHFAGLREEQSRGIVTSLRPAVTPVVGAHGSIAGLSLSLGGAF